MISKARFIDLPSVSISTKRFALAKVTSIISGPSMPVRRAGSIKQAVKSGLIQSGIFYSCVEKGVDFVLAGSIRDDGPLPDVITDTLQAQDAMHEKVRGGFVPPKLFRLPIYPRTNESSKRSQRTKCKTASWLKPKLVAQIEFTEWTPDAHLRHASFLGLRDDKEAKEVVKDTDGSKPVEIADQALWFVNSQPHSARPGAELDTLNVFPLDAY
jgi:hypothetical protein